MCGRFYADTRLEQEIRDLVRSLEKTQKNSYTEEESTGIKENLWDIYPSQEVSVLCGKSRRILTNSMVWGFSVSQGERPLINARSETVLEKNIFRESVLHRRCVIPARGFYEWNSVKEKSRFYLKDSEALWMAGFYDLQDGQDRFVILTTAANASVAPVHSRMPLILKKHQVEEWICRDKDIEVFLHARPELLERQSEYEQLSFWQ